MLTERQCELLNFIEWCPTCANICALYLDTSIRNANKSLKHLLDYGYIKRVKDSNNPNQPYIYYTRKAPINLHHTLLFSRLLAELSESAKIKNVLRARQIDKNIIPDGIIIVEYDGNTYSYLAEIERTTNPREKILKYEKYYTEGHYKELFGVMPTLVFVTNAPVSSDILKNYLYILPLYEDIFLNREMRKDRT